MYDAIGTKPRVERLSGWNSGKEIIYCCAHCGTSLAILGKNEKFCHGCGKKIDWNVLNYVSDDLSSEYWTKSFFKDTFRYQRAICLSIDALNSRISSQDEAGALLASLNNDKDIKEIAIRLINAFYDGKHK